MTQSGFSSSMLSQRRGVASSSPLRMEQVTAHPGQALLHALAASLTGQRAIAYNVNIARVVGDVKAALFLSQLVYWTRYGKDTEARKGWIFKTREQLMLETGLSRHEQESARSKLLKQELIQEARVGSPALSCYRVVPQALGLALAKLLRQQPMQYTLFDLRSNAEHILALLGRSLAYYRVFVDVTGSVTTAVFLSKAIAIQKSVIAAQVERDSKSKTNKETNNVNGENWGQNWFSLASGDWVAETGLTAAQLKHSKQKLCQNLLLKEALQTYPKRRLYLQVDIRQLNGLLRQELMKAVSPGASAGLGLAGRMFGVGVNGAFSKAKQKINKQTKKETNIEKAVPEEQVRRGCNQNGKFTKASKSSKVSVSQNSKLQHEISRAVPEEQGHDDGERLKNKQFSALSAGFTKTANPVGQFSPVMRGLFSHARRSLLACPTASFSQSDGQFSPFYMRARGIGLQSQITTTTTAVAPAAVAPSGESGRQAKTAVVVSFLKTPQKAPAIAQQVSPPPHHPPPPPQHSPAWAVKAKDVRLAEAKPMFLALETAAMPALIWPSLSTFSPDERSSLEWLIRSIEPARQQDLLDEWAGRIRSGSVRQPVSYLRGLVELERSAKATGANGLVLEAAFVERQRRESTDKVNAAVQAAFERNGLARSRDAPVSPMATGIPVGWRERLKAQTESMRQQIRSRPGFDRSR